ncbi:esterase/lipase family protein [Candidatus Omnitrophota bacterium]
MPNRPLLILHGYSGKSTHLKELSSFLKSTNRFKVIDIWLSDYVSMTDEVTINDLGQAMGKALKDKKIPEKRHSFDAIVHSTGGLVIRQYLIHYFLGRPDKCPIRNLVMLAPANFGSHLASLGKSMRGRLLQGWKWDGFMETGTRILDALELGSPISWRMAEQDLFNPKNKIFTPKHLYTTILVGTDVYTDLKKRILHENGSDGTVRASTANLNVAYVKLIFRVPRGYQAIEQKRYFETIPFGVLYNQNHGSIIRPGEDDNVLKDLLIKSLSITNTSQYKEHIKRLNRITKETFKEGLLNEEKQEKYHQYQHVVTRVHDQFGEDIEDYFLEFFQEEEKVNSVMQKVHSEILEKVHKYSNNKSYRSFLFDITDMKKEILDKGKRVDMSLCAAALSKRIYYHNPQDFLSVVSKYDKTLLKPNTTLLLDIELPRIQHESVFRFEKARTARKKHFSIPQS